MNPRHLTALAIAALANLVLWGCEREIAEYPPQPELVTKGPNHRQVLVQFNDLSDLDSVQAICANKQERFPNGCAEYYAPGDPDYPDRAFVIVWTIPPKDFNDVPALAIAGHEIAGHGRGWRHK